ncbi:phage tail protein [Paenibacillus dendritiformis]|uniref:phage tail-collar fiber domain-containing protein n=1 Tax=Paenibacillus dendritiformis TaxID=130049 RepID=UPI001F111B6E|nr:phage tail protein [Paenibacillus dendritiformis]
MGAFTIMITNRGKALQAKAQTGVELHYTRFRVGDGQLGGRPISDLNGLINPILSLPITKLQTRAGGRAVVGTVMTNQDVTTGFYFREIGIFAQDPDIGEILYCYGNAGETADYIPAKGGANIIEEPIEISTIVGNASNVTATIDGSMVYATHDDIAEALEQAKKYADDNNNAKILPPKAFRATDEGDAYPKGVSMFYLDADGIQSGWPFNNGQVLTFVTGKNRVSQMVFETNIATQRIWTRRWSSSQKAWSEFLQIETTAGSAEKIATALREAKAYTDDKTSNIDAPVKSVNGKTGDVALTADDVGAVAKNGDAVIAGMLSMSKNDGPHLQFVGATSAFGEWYVNNERKGWVGVGNGNEPSTVRLTSEVGPLVMQSVKDEVHIHGTKGVFLEGRRVVAELDLVKQSVVDGKGKVAGAINDMGGGPVSANNTFDELAAAIRSIQGASGVAGYTTGFLSWFSQGGVNDKISGRFWFNKDGNAVGLIAPADKFQTYNVELIEVSVAGTIVSRSKLDNVYNASVFTGGGRGIVTPDIVVYMCQPSGRWDNYRLRIRKHDGTLLVDHEIINDASNSVINGYVRILDATVINGQCRFSAMIDRGEARFSLGIIDLNLNRLFVGNGIGDFDSFRSGGRGCFLDRNTAIAYVGGGHQMIRWNGTAFTEVYGGWLTTYTHDNILSAFAYRD